MKTKRLFAFLTGALLSTSVATSDTNAHKDRHHNHPNPHNTNPLPKNPLNKKKLKTHPLIF